MHIGKFERDGNLIVFTERKVPFEFLLNFSICSGLFFAGATVRMATWSTKWLKIKIYSLRVC